MAFNPTVVNTNIPPPNYPNVCMQFPTHSTNTCRPPPIPQQHMLNAGIHVPPANPPPSPFNAVPSNNVPPSPVGFVQNPMQTMWNNNKLNVPIVNNQNFASAPPIPYAQNNPMGGCFQPPPPLQNQQFQNFSNLSNEPHNGLLAIAPNFSSGNNIPNNNFTQNPPASYTPPVGSVFQSSGAVPDSTRNNNFVWPGNSNELCRPPPINQMLFKDNQSHFNINRAEKNWNSIQKTNVPDSSIFQNPGAILSMSANNQMLNSPFNNAAQDNFQGFNVTNRIPVNQGDVNSSPKFNALNNNFTPNNGAPNYNASLNNQIGHFQRTINLDKTNIKRFHQTKLRDVDYRNYNFKQDIDYRDDNSKLVKPNYSEDQNISFQHHNQNLIDVCVASYENTTKKRQPSNSNFLQRNNYCQSNSSSAIIEEFTISDSESIDSKNSPPKYPRNKRIFENLQKINAKSSVKTFQSKGWMTENIQKDLQKRNMLFKQARATNDPAVWDEYNKLKDEINKEITRAKFEATNKSLRNNPKVWEDKGKQFPFNCDTCDRGFSSEGELEVHMGLHIKCHHQGCNFQAHPKLVILHQKMQHDTGYADVINKLQNDEDIKKWREERKRRFPTAENILKKKAEQAEKEARGEVIEEKDYGQFKKRRFENRNRDRKTFNRQDRNNRKRRSRTPFQKAPEIALDQDSGSEGESECPTKLPKFRGMKEDLGCALINDNVKIESLADVKVEEEDIAATSQTSKVSLRQSISSSEQQDEKESDDDDDAPLEIPIQKVSLNDSSNSADENDNTILAGEDQREVLLDAATEDTFSARPDADEKSNNNEKSSLTSKDNNGNKKERNEKRFRPPVPPRPRNSLLKMLLSDEIRHERNVIMQCIRHIVRNNFFRDEANT